MPDERCGPSAAAAATTTCCRRVGGVDLPALGFGMGDVVLGELLKDRGLAPGGRARASMSSSPSSPRTICRHVLALAHELRDAGLRVEYALGAQAVGKQLKLADARQARLAVVIGPDERARGEVVLKDLERSAGSRHARHVSSACRSARLMDRSIKGDGVRWLTTRR